MKFWLLRLCFFLLESSWKMYKNRKYRAGTSTLVRTTSSAISSTPVANDGAESVSNAADATPASSNRVLTDRANVIQEEEDGEIVPSPKVSTNCHPVLELLFIKNSCYRDVSRYKLCIFFVRCFHLHRLFRLEWIRLYLIWTPAMAWN